MKKVKFLFIFIQVQRMRNILAILALFVCTSICLGVEKEIPVPRCPVPRGMDIWDAVPIGYVYNCAVNVDAVFVVDKKDLVGGMNIWKAPVDCILNITTVESQNARIGAYACGARMCRTDKDFDDNVLGPERRITGNKINVCTGRFNNSTLSGAYSVDISAAVDNNKATITAKKGGTIALVYGGRAVDTSASSNTVTISDVDIGNYNIGKDVNENKGKGVVYGGYVHTDGVASNNEVKIDKSVGNERDVSVSGNVFGGYVGGNGTVTINKVHLTSVTVNGNVFGAEIGKDGLASSNTVTITSGAVRNAYGGYIGEKGTATLNTVHLTSVTVDNVFGARIKNGLAEDNKVRIDGNGNMEMNIGGSVYGGYIEENGTATINKVNLTSVTVSNNVYGAEIDGDGLASSNTVTITSGIVKESVYGGSVKYGDAIDNRVTLISGTVLRSIYGGYVSTGTVYLNTVTITSGIVKESVYGGSVKDGDAIDNRVTLISGTVLRSIYGGYVSTGTVYSNTVTITSGTVQNVYGGYILLVGTATLNKVHLTSVTVSSNVYGARVGRDGGRYNEATGDVLASSNTVTITSGIVKESVYGGSVKDGDAIDNRVTLISGTVLRSIYGGCIEEKGTATLNEVNLTDVDVTQDVFGAWIGKTKAERAKDFASAEAGYELKRDQDERSFEDERGEYEGAEAFERAKAARAEAFARAKAKRAEAFARAEAERDRAYVLASSNTVTITSGRVGRNVYGGYIGQNGTASSNTVRINGGKIGGSVFGGCVKENGKAIYNTITITGTEQSFPGIFNCNNTVWRHLR